VAMRAEGGRIEAPKTPSGGMVWGGLSPPQQGCPLPSRLGGLGERRKLPSGVGRAPAGNAFWRILKAMECSFLHRMLKYLEGQGRGLGEIPPLQLRTLQLRTAPTTLHVGKTPLRPQSSRSTFAIRRPTYSVDQKRDCMTDRHYRATKSYMFKEH